MRPLLGEWVFGCDICQEVCPWNNKAPVGGEGARALWQPQEAHIWPDLHAWLEMSDEALNEALLGSPLRRAHPEGLKRNALIALAHQGDVSALGLIEAQLSHPSEAVRLTALWALTALLTQMRSHNTLPLSEHQSELIARLEVWCRAQLSADEQLSGDAAREELAWALGALSALSAQARV
jgi:epoxyqueuosine reductase